MSVSLSDPHRFIHHSYSLTPHKWDWYMDSWKCQFFMYSKSPTLVPTSIETSHFQSQFTCEAECRRLCPLSTCFQCWQHTKVTTTTVLAPQYNPHALNIHRDYISQIPSFLDHGTLPVLWWRTYVLYIPTNWARKLHCNMLLGWEQISTQQSQRVKNRSLTSCFPLQSIWVETVKCPPPFEAPTVTAVHVWEFPP